MYATITENWMFLIENSQITASSPDGALPEEHWSLVPRHDDVSSTLMKLDGSRGAIRKRYSAIASSSLNIEILVNLLFVILFNFKYRKTPDLDNGSSPPLASL
jgi:hypothetical protein